VTAIVAAIRHEANPVMLDFLPASEGVEDHAAQTPLVVAKCARMIELWRRLIALELMAATQAVDLRGTIELSPGTVRSIVARLQEDRPLGTDAGSLYAALSSGKWQA
jgi:histidine ammonia-lyase